MTTDQKWSCNNKRGWRGGVYPEDVGSGFKSTKFLPSQKKWKKIQDIRLHTTYLEICQ